MLQQSASQFPAQMTKVGRIVAMCLRRAKVQKETVMETLTENVEMPTVRKML